MPDLQTARERLAQFAERDAATSPLYSHLAARAAEDDDVLALFAQVRASDLTPTLLFAVVQRLLAKEPLHDLQRYYPTLGGFDGPDADTWPLFKTFLLERADAATELLTTRFTQTNEVQRAAMLYPGVGLAAKQAKGEIGLLEVGASAGLLLGMDGFSYRYQLDGGEQYTAGPTKAAVGLHCAVEGPMPKPPKKIKVGARIGLDRSPIDAADEDELAWLEACVWADQPERARLLRTAAAAQAKKPPELVAGDAVDDLAATAARIPEELPLVVYTSHALVYLEQERRAAFLAALRDLSRTRPLWWVSNGPYRAVIELVVPGRDELAWENTGMGVLCLTRFSGGETEAQILAKTDQHGKRLTWL